MKAPAVINITIMTIVVALLFLACALFVMLRPKTAIAFGLCGVVLFGCGVVRDMMYPPQTIAIVVLG